MCGGVVNHAHYRGSSLFLFCAVVGSGKNFVFDWNGKYVFLVLVSEAKDRDCCVQQRGGRGADGRGTETRERARGGGGFVYLFVVGLLP